MIVGATKAAYRVPFLAQAAGGEIDFLLSQHGAIPNPKVVALGWGGEILVVVGIFWEIGKKSSSFCCGIFVMGNIVNPWSDDEKLRGSLENHPP